MANGTKTGGRRAGTPNRLTKDARETFRLLLEALAPEAEGWIRAAAAKNPAKGAELLLKVSEMFVPRLVRQAPDSSEPVIVEVRKHGTDPKDLSTEELERLATGDKRPPG